MPVINSFRFAVILVVAVFCLYNTRRSENGPKRTRFGRAAITNWPGLKFPLPLLAGWADLVDIKAIPSLAVRKTADAPCDASDSGCTWSCTQCTADDVVTCPDKNTLALSFDDGPSPFTPGLLDFLDKNNVKVTFFVVGSQMLDDANKATLLRAYKAGHQIASHTWSHRALTTLSNQEIIAEVMWTQSIIESVIGVSPTFIRPPYGDVDNRVRAIVKKLGYQVVIWSHDTNDWKLVGDKTIKPSVVADDFAQWINDKSRTKGIIPLEHDLYAETVAAFQGALPIIQGTKINLRTIAECLGKNPYVDSVNVPPTGQPGTTTSVPSAGSTGSDGSGGSGGSPGSPGTAGSPGTGGSSGSSGTGGSGAPGTGGSSGSSGTGGSGAPGTGGSSGSPGSGGSGGFGAPGTGGSGTPGTGGSPGSSAAPTPTPTPTPKGSTPNVNPVANPYIVPTGRAAKEVLSMAYLFVAVVFCILVAF